MRTIDAALQTALAAGNPTPYLKAYVGYSNGTVKNSHTNVYKYILTGTSLEFWIPYDSNFSDDQESIWLERGVTIGGTTYSVTTGRFFIAEEEYLPQGFSRYKGFIFPHKYYSAAGDLTYEAVIDAFCTEWDKTATFKDEAEAWLDYQFLPTGQVIIINSAMRFLNMLQQKRLISCCDNGSEDIRFYSADVLGTSQATFTLKDLFALTTTKTRRRQYVWRDENETVYYDGTATDPLHNLGYLESTDSPPARNTQTFQARAILRPDLRIQDGDVVTLSFDGGTKTATIFAQVTEVYDAQNPKAGLPAWHMILEANPIYHATEGGAMPSTIERVSNYTPLNTSSFDGLLSDQDNNLQAALETIDDHVRYSLHLDRTYYVRTDGSDSNTGLANTAGGAFLTIQKAVDTVAELDLNGHSVTIQIADGTYTGAVALKNVPGFSAAGALIIKGNTTTPANVVISVTGACFTADGISSVWYIKDLKVIASTHCLVASAGSTIRFGNLNFGATTGSHIVAGQGGSIIAISSYAVSGGAVRHLWAETGGYIFTATFTITFSNAPAFTTFCFEFNLGNVQANAMTFTNGGTVTGKRYDVQLNSVAYTAGGGANYFPGNAAGTTATGGQYA